MNFLSVEFLVGRIVLVCGIAMLFPVLVSLTFLESDVLALLFSAALTLIIGYSMTMHGKNEPNLTNREAIMTVCLTWLMVSLCGALPYMLSATLSPFYSFIESASGFTTIGETLIPDLTKIPKSILLWRSLTQWLGGMGVVVLFVSFLPHYGSGANTNLFNAELPGPAKERVMPRIGDTAFLLWKIYTIITVIFACLMLLCGLDLFESINHSLASIGLGGFSIYNNSISHYDNRAVEILTAFFSIISAGSFYLYYLVYTRGWKNIRSNTEFNVLLFLIVSCSFLLTLSLFLQGNYSFNYSIYHACFHVIQAITTCGFVLTDLSQWPPFCQSILYLLILIGGCAGSAAGGLKIFRLVVLTKIGWVELKRILHPKMIANITMNGKILPSTLTSSITRYFFLYIGVYFILTLLLTLTGTDFLEAFLMMASVMSSAGSNIPFSLLPGVHSFQEFNDLGKAIITFGMFVGRLELFTVLVLLRPEFWRKTRNW